MFSLVIYEYDEKDREIVQCVFYIKLMWVIVYIMLCNVVYCQDILYNIILFYYIILIIRVWFKNFFFILRKCNLFLFENIF